MTGPVSRDDELAQRVQSALAEAYILDRVLGEGGFAVVYAARDRALHRSVAIKVLRPELAGSPTIRERFRREAEAIAGVRHPHVVPIYAVGEGAGLAWFVMPLVAGESLRQRLDREPRLPVGEVRRVLREACDALASAHQAGVIHRDIKPDNILLEGEERRVVLTDFGIAKAIGEDHGTGPLTATGVVVGTPHYMSPEQASGERTLDHRSDLYSLGVVAYQMLAGVAPFDAPSAGALLAKHLTEDPVPLSRRRPDCPADLAAAVMRCLAKAPERRWQAAADLRTALGASPPAAFGAARRSGAAAAAAIAEPVRRFRVVAAGGAVVAIAALAVDVVLGRVLVGPPIALIVVLVVAGAYGRLWTAGFDWRDVARLRSTARSSGMAPIDSAELGPYRDVVAGMRNDRAAIVAVLARSAHAERAPLAGLLPAVDALIARAREVARQLHTVDRQTEPGLAELDRRVADARAEPPSPGREQRIAVLERRREAVASLTARQTVLAAVLTRCAEATTAVRAALERSGAAERDGIMPVLRDALAADGGDGPA